MTGLYRGLCALGLLLSLGVPGVGWCWQIQSQPCLSGPAIRLIATHWSMDDMRLELHMGPKERIPEVMAELKESWRRTREYRRATYVPMGPLATGVGPGQLGLMEPPCPERGLWTSMQVGSVKAGARSEAVVAFNTSLFLIPLPRALPGLSVSGHLSTLLDGLGTGAARMGPASVGASYQLWRLPFLLREIDGVARPFARVHLPSSFVEGRGGRLGLEPGIIWRGNHYSNDDAFHLGVSFPLLSAETLDGHRPGFHVSTRMGLSLRDSALNATTVELGMLHDSRGLEQFTVGGAYRFAVPRVGMELALTVALGGRNKGTGSLAMRFTFDPMDGLMAWPYFP
ncbi:hypothetical protein ATI61_118167 [Archangium gephyra]|uniref:Transporter n=2 Tax=Archangium gephyra TaxID=48 RepID=A0ABX9JND2_9BACT|nr:hypothetical protein ATI61_118167 [Archangium gephyra]